MFILKKLMKNILMIGLISMASSTVLAVTGPITMGDFSSRWSGFYSLESSQKESFYRLTTDAQDGPSFLAADKKEGISLEKKYFRFKIRVNSLEAWSGMELRLSSDDDNSFKNYMAIPIPYYMDREFNILQPGHWAEYTLTLGEAKLVGNPDINKIRQVAFYISGNKALVEPFTVDLKDFKVESAQIPAIISMTFDDGYDDHFKAAQIMNEYNLRGTAYVMTNQVDLEGYLTKEDLLVMDESFGWSISSHHKIPITEFSTPQLTQEVESTFTYLENLGFNETIPHFAYPLGKQDRELTLPYIRENFLTARVAGGGAETLPPSDWHMLRTYNVTPDKTPEMIAQRVQKAIDNNEWLILMFHYFTDGKPEDDLTYNYDDFKKLCELISKSKAKVHPVNEVYEAFQ
jgi:peptidoglycan/xylan/chitin deacetylase (PgdA/CDA1 family)